VTDIDWPALRAAATAIATNAYAPYSRLHVGVAALLADGRILTGCNVENASYGLTTCAEVGLVHALHASGGGQLIAIACTDDAGTELTPCGRCRQILIEHGGPDLVVNETRTIAELLPGAFLPVDLP
jgi:cytidine deaminase